MLAYVTLPRLELPTAKIDREVYVISLASDLRGESNHRPAATSLNNSPIQAVSPEVQGAMRFMIAAVSNIFTHIDRKQPVSLSGDGIVLYPPADPSGMLALHFVVVESDRKARDFGAFLKKLFSDKKVAGLLKTISQLTAAAQNVPAELLTSLIGVSSQVLADLLVANKDDALFSHSHSGILMSAYGGAPLPGTTYDVGNKKVKARLRVIVQA